MQPTLLNHPSPGRWANAGLLHGVATEAKRRNPHAAIGYRFERIAQHLPTRTSFAPSHLVHELRQACIDTVGPTETFDIFVNCFVGRSYPLVLPILAAPDAPSLVRRLEAVENLTPRVAHTILIGAGESWVELHQLRNDVALAATASYAIGYWGMILGLFTAAGYRDLVLTSQGTAHPTVIYADGKLSGNAHTALSLMRHARLAWRKRDPFVPASLHPVVAVSASIVIERITRAISSAMECGSPSPSLQKIAAMTHRSIRSVQRDLISSWTSLRDIRSSVRMRQAALLLAEPNVTLREVAFNSGFSDAPHLVREFNRVVGLTPQNYRMMYRM